MIPEMTVTESLGATPLGGTFETESLSAASLGGTFDLTTSEPRVRTSSSQSSLTGRLALAGLLLMGLVIAASASRSYLLLPASVGDVPGWLAGPFGRTGIHLGLGGVITVLALILISYAVVVKAADELSGRAVLMSIAAFHALVLLAPPLLSTDIFSYMAYGRMTAVYGVNPYLHGPGTILLDPLYPFIGSQWVGTPTAYGPLFTALSSVLAPLDIAGSVLAYKSIAALSSLTLVVVVWNAARLRGLNPVKAAAIVGLNPVIVVYGVGGGHNDLLMLAILLSGVYVLLQRKQFTSGALIVTATVIKFTAGLMLPFALAESAARREGAHARLAILKGAAVAAALAGILGFALFGSGPLHLLGTLQAIQNGGGFHSVAGMLLHLLGLTNLGRAVGLVLDVGFAVCVVWLLRRVWRGELDWITGAGWATFAMLLTAGLLLPWYVGWLIPLAALSSDRRLLITAVLMTGLGLTSL